MTEMECNKSSQWVGMKWMNEFIEEEWKIYEKLSE